MVRFGLGPVRACFGISLPVFAESSSLSARNKHGFVDITCARQDGLFKSNTRTYRSVEQHTPTRDIRALLQTNPLRCFQQVVNAQMERAEAGRSSISARVHKWRSGVRLGRWNLSGRKFYDRGRARRVLHGCKVACEGS